MYAQSESKNDQPRTPRFTSHSRKTEGLSAAAEGRVQAWPIMHRMLCVRIIALICLDCRNKILQTAWLRQQKFVSHNSGGWKFKIKVLQGSVPGRVSLPGL
jgi:hypothetical protein